MDIQHVANIDALAQKFDSTLRSYPDATVAISLRDRHHDIIFDRNAERVFHAASTMKVPVMIEIFRQVKSGRFSLQDSILVKNSFRSIIDGSLYSIEDDSEDVLYNHLGKKNKILDLVTKMIIASSNLATNLLIDYASVDSIQATAERKGVKTMRVLRGVEDSKAFNLGRNNTVTSSDLALLLEAIRDGNAISPELDAKMVEILSRQQYNEMIPAGLPDSVIVAHKTGQITGIHHDAAIIYPSSSPPYVLVILIEGIEDDTISSKLGAEIASIIHHTIRP